MRRVRAQALALAAIAGVAAVLASFDARAHGGVDFLNVPILLMLGGALATFVIALVCGRLGPIARTVAAIGLAAIDIPVTLAAAWLTFRFLGPTGDDRVMSARLVLASLVAWILPAILVVQWRRGRPLT